MVGLGADFGDIADYVAHNDLGHGAAAARARTRAASPGASCWPPAWSSTARAATRAPSTASSRPARGRRRTSTPAASSRRARAAAARWSRDRCPRTRRWTRATSTPPPSCTRSICSARSPARATASRQSRCATTTSTARGCRATRPTPGWRASSARRWRRGEPPRVFEDGGQLRDFVHVATSPAPTCSRSRRAPTSRGVQRRLGHAAQRRLTWRARWPPRSPAAPPPIVTGEFRRGDVRHVFAAPDRAREVLGFTAGTGLEEGMAEFAHAELRRPPRATSE